MEHKDACRVLPCLHERLFVQHHLLVLYAYPCCLKAFKFGIGILDKRIIDHTLRHFVNADLSYRDSVQYAFPRCYLHYFLPRFL